MVAAVRRAKSWWHTPPILTSGVIAVVTLALVVCVSVPAASAAPLAPLNVQATGGTESPTIAVLTWDSSAAAAGYNVYRSVVDTTTVSAWERIGRSSSLSYTDDSGVPGQDYWYRVTAYDVAGVESALSASTSPAVVAGWIQNPHGTYESTSNNCRSCHEPHEASSDRYILRQTGAADAIVAVCFACHDGTGSSPSTNIKRYYPTASGGLAIQEDDGSTNFGHRIQTPGGTIDPGKGLPCYNCHDPHSTRTDALRVKTSIGGVVHVLGDDDGEIGAFADPNPDIAAANVRLFCFACHTGSKNAGALTTYEGTNSSGTGYTNTIVAADTVEGIGRLTYDDVKKTGLRLPPLDGHYTDDPASQGSCYQCHLNDYSSATSNNVHNPGQGLSPGGIACYVCHSAYKSPMDKNGATKAESVHHVMGSATQDGDIAPNAGTYPNTANDVFCVSCHTDHNYFNGATTKAGNLRTSALTTSGATTSTADFITGTPGAYGVCVSCHTTSLAKQGMGTDQLNVGAATTPVIPGAEYEASAHQYVVPSAFGTSSTFDANCSKCHSDEQKKSFATGTYKFGTHYSASVGILGALGATPPMENACFACHNATAAKYAESLSDDAKSTQTEFGMASSHDLTKVACVNCHNVHEATKTAPVADPDNTYNTYSAGPTATPAQNTGFCLKCHNGAPLTRVVSDTKLVPYAVNPPASVDVGEHYTVSGHGDGLPTVASFNASTFAVNANDVTSDWANDANSLGFTAGNVATSPTDNDFEMRHSFGVIDTTGWLGITSASITVNSRANGNWGGSGTLPPQSGLSAVFSPTADGDTAGTWTYSAGTAGWSLVDEYPAANTADRIVTPTAATARYLFISDTPTVPANATNIAVSVTYNHRDNTSGTNKMASQLKIGGNYYRGADVESPATTAAYLTTTQNFAVNPATGSAWTGAGVNAIQQFGVYSSDANPAIRVTQVYMTITYDIPGAPYSYDDTWAIQYTTVASPTEPDWVNFPGSPSGIKEDALADHTVDLSGILTLANINQFQTRIIGRVVGTVDNANTVDWDFSELDVTHTENVSGGFGPGQDCRACHEQHGSSLVHLLSTTVGGQSVASYTDTADQRQCLACHRDGGAAGTADIARYYPSAVGGTAPAGMTRSGHRTKTAGTMAAGSALPCRSCHNPHGSAGSGYMLAVRTQLTAGTDTVIGLTAGQLVMEDSTQIPANANNVRNFCFTCHTTSNTSFGYNGTGMALVPSGAEVLGISRTSGALKLPDIGSIPGHKQAETTYSCYLCHGDDFSEDNSVNVHNPAAGESRGGIPCYTCHTVYQNRMEDGIGAAVGTQRDASYHHVLGSATAQGDTVTYPTNATSKTDVYCLSCHVDHDLFSPLVNGANDRGANLRASLGAAAPTAGVNTDFNIPASTPYYATTLTDTSGDWTNDANSTGAPNDVSATSASDNVFDGRHSFTLPASFTSAMLTVRSRANGLWGQTAPITNHTDYVYASGDVAPGNWAEFATQTSPDGDAFLWNEFDEDPAANDGNATAIQSNGANEYQASSPNPTVPSNATGISVSIVWTVRDATAGAQNSWSKLRVNGTYYQHGTARDPGTTYATYTDTWASNPAGGAWTPATVNTINGLGFDTSAATVDERVTAARIVITYQTPAATYDDTWAIQYSVNGGANWADVVPANDSAESELTDHTIDLSGILTPANAANFRVRIVGAAVGGVDNANTIEWDSSTVAVSSGVNAQICMSCHSTTQVKDNANQKTFANNTVTPALSTTDFDASAHDYAASSTFSDATTFNANCAKCHDSEIDGGGMEAGKSTTGFQLSTGNQFSVHYSAARRILGSLGVGVTDPQAEEAVCYACHSVVGSGLKSVANRDWYNAADMNVNSQSVYAIMGSTYAHNVDDTIGLHRTNPTDESQAYLNANRHVECADCHDPHGSAPGVHTTGSALAGNVLTGAWGVRPSSWPANWTAPAANTYVDERMSGDSTDYEAYVCFKCHSGYTSRPNSPSGGYAGTDLALEFNPNNESGHNVLGDVFTRNITRGGATWSKPTNLSLAAGWTVDSGMTCSDCHAYDGTGARGPHGSSVKFMLKWGSNTTPWYTVRVNDWSNAALICNRCHTTQPHGTWMAAETDHNSRQCRRCHITIPHGWKRPRMLMAPSDPAPYRNTGDGATWVGIQLVNVTEGNINKNDCVDSACGGRHEPSTGDQYW